MARARDRGIGGQAVPSPPPRPPTHPRKLGPLKRFGLLAHSSIHALYERSYDMKMGDVRGPTRRYFFLNDAPIVNRVLAADPDCYPKSDLMSATLRQLLGESVFVTNGEQWRRQRRMLGPAFEHARIDATFVPMVDAARDMLERLDPLATGASIPIDLEMTHVTADVIFRTIFSRTMRRDEAETIFRQFERYQELAWRHGVWMMSGVPEQLSLPRLRAKRPARAIRDLLGSAVDARLAALRASEAPPYRDILQSMIDARDPDTGEAFDREGLVDQVAITFLAGHETSASALAWTLFLLGRHPQHIERLEAEADAFWEREPSARKLRTLLHTRDCFREAMRLYPPVAFVPRDARNAESIRGKRVRPGSVLFLSPYLMHRQRRTWSEPDAFDPDRFRRPSERAAVRDAYMPFIKGPRVCLGASFAMQEAVIILSAIASRFRIADDPDHEPKPIARLTLRSENGIRIRLVPRASGRTVRSG